MHEPIQAKGPTMSEQLMEQYRLRGQRKCRNACIAAIVTVVLVLAVAGGVWWTAGDGSALVRNMFKPKATPATQPVVNSTATFAYRYRLPIAAKFDQRAIFGGEIRDERRELAVD